MRSIRVLLTLSTLVGLLPTVAPGAQQPIPPEQPIPVRPRPAPPPPPPSPLRPPPGQPVTARAAAGATETTISIGQGRMVDLYFFQIHQPRVLQSLRELIQGGKLPASALAGFTDLGLAAATQGSRIATNQIATSAAGIPPSTGATSIRGPRPVIPNAGRAAATATSVRFTSAPVHPAALGFGTASVRFHESWVEYVRITTPRDGPVTVVIEGNTQVFMIERVEARTGVWLPAGTSARSVGVVGRSFNFVPELTSSGGRNYPMAQAGQPLYVDVRFRPQTTGDFSATLVVRGNLWEARVPLSGSATLLGTHTGVGAFPEVTRLLSLHGQRHEVPVEVFSIGPSAANVTVRGRSAPPNVEVGQVAATVQPFGRATVMVPVLVMAGAPVAEDMPIVFDILPSTGTPSTVDLTVSVYKPFHQFWWGGIKHLTRYEVKLNIQNDGTWSLHIEAEKKAELGDDFSVAVFFDGDPWKYGINWTFSIGGTLTGGSSQLYQSWGGVNPWVRDNYLAIMSGAIPARICMIRDPKPCQIVSGPTWRGL